jgi:hypothetical protein
MNKYANYVALDEAEPTSPNLLPQAPEETTAEYLKRNIAKFPANAAGQIRSLFGAKDIQDLITQGVLGPEEAEKFRATERVIVPQAKTEQQLIEAGVPKYYVENRPEDLPFNILTGAAIGGVPAGAYKSIGNLAKYGATQALAATGGVGAQKMAKNLGYEELGQTAASILGSIGTPFIAKHIFKPLSTTLKGKEQHKERRDFDKRKVNNIRKSREDLKKETNKIQQSMTDYDKEIESLKKQQTPHYEEAEKFEGTKLAAQKLYDRLIKSDEKLSKGFTTSEKRDIREILKQMEDSIKLDKKTAQYTMSLGDAKEFKKNINSRTYERSLPDNVKNIYKGLLADLKDFIGGAEPSHEMPYRKGEITTQRIGELRKDRDQFFSQQKKEINRLKKEQSSYEKQEARTNYDTELKNQTNAQKTFEKLVENPLIRSAGGAYLSDQLLGGLSKYLFGTKLPVQIAGAAGAEIAQITDILKRHPQFKRDIAAIYTAGAKKQAIPMAELIINLNKKILNSTKEENQQEGKYANYVVLD